MRQGTDYTGVSIVYLCHDGQGEYLLQKRGPACRDEHHRWDIGGGGLDVHTTVEQTLHKEIREEYATTVRSYEFLGFRDVHRIHAGVRTHWIALDFKVLVDRALVTNAEPHKFDEIGWFRKGAFPMPLHSQLPTFLERYDEHI